MAIGSSAAVNNLLPGQAQFTRYRCVLVRLHYQSGVFSEVQGSPRVVLMHIGG